MAKGKKPAARAKRKVKVAPVVRMQRQLLDKRAADYAALLADPCNGPLITGPFGDGGAGLVSRFEIDFLVNTNATDTCAYYAYVPSCNIAYISAAAITSDGATISQVANGTNCAPGYTFLNANASSYRCLSACVQLYWPGTELTRSGVISLGQYSAFATQATPTTVSSTRSGAQYVERTPEVMSEITWRPNNFDLEWQAPGQLSSLPLLEKSTAMIATAAGIPVSTGMRVRVVAVYEWLPLNVSGFSQTTNRGNNSANTYTDVLRYLDSTGDWMYRGALAVARGASSVYRAASAIGKVAYGVAKYAPMIVG
jgi:hypothetical protein